MQALERGTGFKRSALGTVAVLCPRSSSLFLAPRRMYQNRAERERVPVREINTKIVSLYNGAHSRTGGQSPAFLAAPGLAGPNGEGGIQRFSQRALPGHCSGLNAERSERTRICRSTLSKAITLAVVLSALFAYTSILTACSSLVACFLNCSQQRGAVCALSDRELFLHAKRTDQPLPLNKQQLERACMKLKFCFRFGNRIVGVFCKLFNELFNELFG